MLARSKLLLSLLPSLLLAGCSGGCSQKPCPDGAELAGYPPPQGTRQWCHKQAPDGSFVRHGRSTEWYPGGQKMEEGQYREGQRHGRWVRWYVSGQKAWEGDFAQGQRSGQWLRWHEDGTRVPDVEPAEDRPADRLAGQAAAAPARDAGATPKAWVDTDNDSISDDQDNCPYDPNPLQEDIDGDGQGDACDDDIDGDGRDNVHDNCPRVPNWDSVDTDGDGQGDACDDDIDGDGVPNERDNCPLVPNPDQANATGEGPGDACKPRPKLILDSDGDGIPDPPEGAGPFCSPANKKDCYDNCPGVPNPDQGFDACNADGDADGDGISNAQDNCLLVPNPGQEATRGQAPAEGGDACWMDMDGDGIRDMEDNCPLVKNPDQRRTLDHGPGDACIIPPDP